MQSSTQLKVLTHTYETFSVINAGVFSLPKQSMCTVHNTQIHLCTFALLILGWVLCFPCIVAYTRLYFKHHARRVKRA